MNCQDCCATAAAHQARAAARRRQLREEVAAQPTSSSPASPSPREPSSALPVPSLPPPPFPPPQCLLDDPCLPCHHQAAITSFHSALDSVSMELCVLCKEEWFNLHVDGHGICQRCLWLHHTTKARMWTSDNAMDPGKVSCLSELTPQARHCLNSVLQMTFHHPSLPNKWKRCFFLAFMSNCTFGVSHRARQGMLDIQLCSHSPMVSSSTDFLLSPTLSISLSFNARMILPQMNVSGGNQSSRFNASDSSII